MTDPIVPLSNPNPKPHRHHSHSQTITNRAKGLRKIGVSEEDVKKAELLMKQIPPTPSSASKAESILGYAECRLKREKALRTLGTSEDEVELENSKNLGALGLGGRRRSFSVKLSDDAIKDLHYRRRRKKNKPLKYTRRFSTGDTMLITSHSEGDLFGHMEKVLVPLSAIEELSYLRRQSRENHEEIDLLRSRLASLEDRDMDQSIVSDSSDDEEKGFEEKIPEFDV